MYESRLRDLRINVEAIIGRHVDAYFAITDYEGRFLWCNQSCCSLFKYNFDEMITTVNWKRISSGQDDLDADLAALNRLKSGEEKEYYVTKRYLDKLGNVLTCSIKVIRLEGTENLFVEFRHHGSEEQEIINTANWHIDKMTRELHTLAVIVKESNESFTEQFKLVVKQQADMIAVLSDSQWFGKMVTATVETLLQLVKDHPKYFIAMLAVIVLSFIGEPAFKAIEAALKIFGVFKNGS